MASPIIYGPNFSTYVRTTRLALTEKPAPYQLTEIAFMEGAHKRDEFLQRNPFGKVPAFEHDGLKLYETSAITRYIDRRIKLHGDQMVTVVLPEFVPAKWWQHLLHNQSSLLLKGALLFKPNVIVISVPYHLRVDRNAANGRNSDRPRGSAD